MMVSEEVRLPSGHSKPSDTQDCFSKGLVSKHFVPSVMSLNTLFPVLK